VALRIGLVPQFWNWISVRSWVALLIAGLLALSSAAEFIYGPVYRDRISFIVTPLLTAVWITQLIALRGAPLWSWTSWGWVRYLGRISYGLYLVHSLIFFLTFEKAVPYLRRLFPGLALPTAIRDHVWTLVVLMLTITVASLSFHYFERPFLRLKKRFTFVAAREEVTPSA